MYEGSILIFLHWHLRVHNDKRLSLLPSDPRLNDARLVMHILSTQEQTKRRIIKTKHCYVSFLPLNLTSVINYKVQKINTSSLCSCNEAFINILWYNVLPTVTVMCTDQLRLIWFQLIRQEGELMGKAAMCVVCVLWKFCQILCSP